jgi:hypothetical protein
MLVMATNEIFQILNFSENLWGNIRQTLLLVPPQVNNDSLGYYVVGWLILTGLIFIAKRYTSDAFNCTLSFTYSLLPTDGESSNQAKSSRSAASQRTFSFPDALVYNYFDPDALPPLVEKYSGHIFNTVQTISAEIGFQVRDDLSTPLSLLSVFDSPHRLTALVIKPSTS